MFFFLVLLVLVGVAVFGVVVFGFLWFFFFGQCLEVEGEREKRKKERNSKKNI